MIQIYIYRIGRSGAPGRRHEVSCVSWAIYFSYHLPSLPARASVHTVSFDHSPKRQGCPRYQSMSSAPQSGSAWLCRGPGCTAALPLSSVTGGTNSLLVFLRSSAWKWFVQAYSVCCCVDQDRGSTRLKNPRTPCTPTRNTGQLLPLLITTHSMGPW